MATDPVCRMSVDEKQAVATVVYDGKTYYFCSAGCKRSFEKEPGFWMRFEAARRSGFCSGRPVPS